MPAEAVVTKVSQTAVAPQSHAVKCALPDRSKKKLFTVYVPHAAGPVENPAAVLVPPPGRSGSPVAVAWFFTAPGAARAKDSTTSPTPSPVD